MSDFDGQIAAIAKTKGFTAKTKGFTVATRNIKDFEGRSVRPHLR